mmetsp:Transcript_2983/g.7761  ORF Transcript_2983/g.7761 Transcript_2983/m.7761 type:complete len:259 (-) Transcript_2983:89-865(-)
MKISAKILALCALPATAAFTVPSKVTKPSFALHSTAEVPVPSGGAVSWELPSISPIKRVEGESRHTFNFGDISSEVVQVAMKTSGRPMNADIEVWIGPDWTPLQLKTYCDDGLVRPMQALVGTRNKAAQVEIRNTGPYEFPLDVACSYAKAPLKDIRNAIPASNPPRYIEGGAIYSLPFDNTCEQVQVLLNTDSRQLNAVVELLNGPNNIKQQYEIFTNNGLLNSLYVVFNTPGSGNTVRVKNLAPLEFPCKAFISAV